MASSDNSIMSNRLKRAVFVIFALLTVAVIASEARSLEASGSVPANRSEPLLQQSLIVSGAGKLGLRVVEMWAKL